jgi:hypothetical protein
VGAFGQKLLEPRCRVRDRVRPREAYRVEALRAGFFDKRRLQRGLRLGCQKSRLA